MSSSSQRSGGSGRRSGAEAHDHGHDHGHVHHDAAAVRTQPVVLDLGENVGALVVYTDPELVGAEIEISPAGNDAERSHKQVLWRTVGPSTVAALVYDSLPAGEYTLWLAEGAELRNVRVTGGAVTELDRRSH